MNVAFLESPVLARIRIVFLAALVAGTGAAGEVVEIDNAARQATLTGKLAKRVFAGPPNYRSIQSGDRPETYWILLLTKPIRVKAWSSDPVNESEQEVKELQLV